MFTHTLAKKNSIILCTILLTGLAVLFINAGGSHRRGAGRERPDGQVGPRFFERFFERLELTPEQRLQVFELLKNHRETLADLGTDQIAARKALAKIAHQPSTGEAAISEACSALARAQLQFNLECGRLWSGVYPLLTAEQQTELCSMGNRGQRMRDGLRHGGSDRFGFRRQFGRLELTDEQEVAVREILAQEKSSAEAGREALQKARLAVHAAIRQPAFDAKTIETASAAAARAEADLQLQQFRVYTRIYQLLDAGQRALLDRRSGRMQKIL